MPLAKEATYLQNEESGDCHAQLLTESEGPSSKTGKRQVVLRSYRPHPFPAASRALVDLELRVA